MLTRKWMRLIVMVGFFLAVVRVCFRMREKSPEVGLNPDFEFAALMRERSGAKKRIPPDSNHTDVTEDDLTNKEVLEQPVNDTDDNTNFIDAWRARKFVDPAVIDPEVEAGMWMEVTNHSAPQIEEMRAMAYGKWKANREGVLKFRKQLEDMKATVGNVIMTQNNTKEGQQVRYALNRDIFFNVTNEFVTFLPKKSPFTNLRLPRCAVVGASGILVDSNCGEEIDKADFIFRCNLPELKGYDMDVGRKSNMTTINTVSILKKRYHFMQTIADSQKFIQKLQELHGHLWMPLFGLRSGLSYSLLVARLVHHSKDIPKLRLAIGNPEHFAAVQDYWRSRFTTTRISTGLYLVTLALSMCEETHLYGFWPFSRDLNLRPTKYHYYDNTEPDLSVHNFSDEFRLLLDMHRNGLVRMHLDKCSEPHVSLHIDK